MTVRFVDESTAEVTEFPAVEWLDIPAARTPYPAPSVPLGMRPTVTAGSPFAPVYVDPNEAARWADTPAPGVAAVAPEWEVPAEDGPAPSAGVELVTRWIAGAEVTVPRIVRRVRPPVRRIVRVARWMVAGSAVTFVALAVLGIATR